MVKKTKMYEMVAELMILGFISLLLTFGEHYILKICIPEKAAASMLPCPALSTHDQDKTHRRRLAAAATSSRCDEVISSFHYNKLYSSLFCYHTILFSAGSWTTHTCHGFAPATHSIVLHGCLSYPLQFHHHDAWQTQGTKKREFLISKPFFRNPS